MNIVDDGIEFAHEFFSQQELNALRAELDFMFSKNIIMGPGYSLRLSQFVEEIPWPISKVKSVNLLEKAVKILERLDSYPELKNKKFKLAHFAIYRESGNNKALHWHSDGRNGNLIRAQVCLRGGGPTSGSFQYMRATNKVPNIEGTPTPEVIEGFSDRVISCNEANGTLYLFDTYGVHNKTVCNEERMSMMFDFLPEGYVEKHPGDVASDLVLSIDNLSAPVVANLDRFQINRSAEPSANTADYYKFRLKFGGLQRKISLIQSLKNFIRRFI